MKAHYVAKYTFIEFFIEEEIVVALYMGHYHNNIPSCPLSILQTYFWVSHKRKAGGQVARCKKNPNNNTRNSKMHA